MVAYYANPTTRQLYRYAVAPDDPPAGAVQIEAVTYDEWVKDLAAYDLVDGSLRPVAATLAGRRAELAAYRYGRQVLGVLGTDASGQSFVAATDPASLAMLSGAYQYARDGHLADGMLFKTASGDFVHLTAQGVQDLAVRAANYVSLCFAREAQLLAALATDLATDVTAGWPGAPS